MEMRPKARAWVTGIFCFVLASQTCPTGEIGVACGAGRCGEVDGEEHGDGLFGGGGEVFHEVDGGPGGVFREGDGDLLADCFAVEGGGAFVGDGEGFGGGAGGGFAVLLGFEEGHDLGAAFGLPGLASLTGVPFCRTRGSGRV